jgi:MinD superfamily P-loop ATPase
MILAIASGKGGTGKTTVAVNLARVSGGEVQLLDCDVEEPNAHLFLEGTPLGEETVSVSVPRVDEFLCDACGECARFCRFKAIASFGTAPLFFPEMCHGCGGCAKVCPRSAIHETTRRVGVIETSRAGNVTLVQGRLDIGVAMAPPVIRAVRRRNANGANTIIDAPPGTTCLVIASLRGSDYVLLVTEPTPFGLHDLELAVAMVRELEIPFGVVINRAGSGDDRVNRYCSAERIPVLQEIPDDRRIAEAYSRGELIVDALPEYRNLFVDLYHRSGRRTVGDRS